MILTQRSALFLHIPKTGGNSVQNALEAFADDGKVLTSDRQDGVERYELRHPAYPTTKHSTLEEYRKYCEPDLFNRLLKFTVIRNTYGRVMSYYFSPHRGDVEWDRDRFKEFVGSILPLKHYIGYPGQALSDAVNNLDVLLRFERLSEDFCTLSKRLGLRLDLGHFNKSGYSCALSHYDADLIAYVRSLFREEIAFFDFKPPSGAGILSGTERLEDGWTSTGNSCGVTDNGG